MESLIKSQSALTRAIQKINAQISKDPLVRRTKEYGETRLQSLINIWTEFEKNNEQIELYKANDPKHTYFAENYFEGVEAIYEQTRISLEDIIRDAIERRKHTEDIEIQLKLIKKQEALVESLMRVAEEVENELNEPASLPFIIQKTKLLNNYWQLIVTNHGEIVALGKCKVEYFENDVFAQTERSYQTAMIKLQSVGDHVQQVLENGTRSGIKLPQIQIPIFYGDYLKWQPFKELFTELIHKNARLTESEKLYHLKTTLKNEPSELIQHLTISNANYSVAWDIVCKRYNNVRAILTALLNNLIEQPDLLKESADGLKNMHDTIVETMAAIKNLGVETKSWDPIILHVLTQKLDKESRRLYEQKLSNPREVQNLEDFLNYLEARFQSLEATNSSFKVGKPIKRSETKIHHSAIVKKQCPVCSEEHKIFFCEKFKNMSVPQRYDTLKKHNMCLNCLTEGHHVIACRSFKKCKICNKKHNTLLHVNKKTENTSKDQKNESRYTSNNEPINVHTANIEESRKVLLATALIRVVGKQGRLVTLRALIDQGAQTCFITEEAVQQLSVPKKKVEVTVSGVGDTSVGRIEKCVEIIIRPNFTSTFGLNIDALILKKLTNTIPSETIESNSWKHIEQLQLANPYYYTPGRIDMILGADVYAKILKNGIIRGPPGTPVAQCTELGWILFGEINTMSNFTSKDNLKCLVSEVDLDKTLRKFWELEETVQTPIMTPEEIKCEEHYRTTHRRDANGRYIVRIPFKEDPELANIKGTRELAMARLLQMEKKFKQNKVFGIMYRDFMKEYISLGHMKPATPDTGATYYFPHHAVEKQDSSTTKLRVVFDASCKRKTAESLNDIMMVGPQIQENLLTILLRWRKHEIVFTADIEKMYRQILVDHRDRKFQRILWRDSPNEEILEYELSTVTYGTAAAPFLAIRTLQQLAMDHGDEYPEAKEVIMKDTYVDDVVSGGDSIEETIQLSKQLINLLNRGGFKLRKWASNSNQVLHTIPWELHELSSRLDFNDEQIIKALGVYWNPKTDKFKIQVNLNTDLIPCTKRELLSDAARIYDPIGLLAPITIKVKLLIQDTWSTNLGWDEKLPATIQQAWLNFKKELPCLQQIEIPRWVCYNNHNQYCELHGFCDASEKAYSAVVYIRIKHQNQVFTTLLTAKTKVAPLKSKLTLPRLELCGAALLATLLRETAEALAIENIRTVAWTDSEIVLAWIKGDPHKWKTFVANRVSHIQSSTERSSWYHVQSEENPADVASRGQSPQELKQNAMWWTGPQWLQACEILYPDKSNITTESEKRNVSVYLVNYQGNNICSTLLQRFSSINKVQNTVAYCLRFIKNCQKANKIREVGLLTTEERERALCVVLRQTQIENFKNEHDALNKQKELSKSSRLLDLSPLIDAEGLIRVGGRLENSLDLTFDQKHPVILPHNSDLTNLIIHNAHLQTLHGGNTMTLQAVRQRYWVINGSKAVKRIVHKCIKCHRYKAQSAQQMMGMLPKARVTANPAFTHSGVDYAGPFELLMARGRGNRTTKGYLAIFICLATKAMHIEVVTDLTSRAFIAALKRFNSRRGNVMHIYSDNATNFTGASKILSDLHQDKSFKNEMQHFFSTQGIQWHFIPPSSPHFGGLWEAGVKSVKHHLRRVIGENKLTYEEMSTLMSQIEACLNSRPLCPLSEDPESLEVLTPSHFLNTRPICSIPEQDHLGKNPNALNRWERLENLHQEFWRKWSNEFVGRLQQRPKWMTKAPNIDIGHIVLVKEDNLPPSRWALGRVIETHPGNDGLTRVVTLLTKNGKVKRPIAKLSLLPVIDNQSPVSNNVHNNQGDECDTLHGKNEQGLTGKDKPAQEQKRHFDTQSGSNDVAAKKHRGQLGSSGTYPHRINWSFALIIALIFPLVFGQTSQENYVITNITGNEGIYFNHVSEIQFYSSEWNLLTYYDMDIYWKEFLGMKNAVKMLEQLCKNERIESNSVCEAILGQLRHQLAEVSDINEILYQQNERSVVRKRRGLFNAIGILSNRLFGTLDQEFADIYEQHIKEAKNNDHLVRELLKNQTSILDSTLNVFKKDKEYIQQQIKSIERHINDVSILLNHSQHENMVKQAFNSAAILLILIVSTFQNVQKNILSTITDVKHSRINTLLLTPIQLKEQLRIIRDHIPQDLALPGLGEEESLLTIYKSLHAKIRITKQNVLVSLSIPLLNSEKFDLFEMIPVPAVHNGHFIYVKPTTKYLAINHRQDRFAFLETIQSFQKLTDKVIFGQLEQPILTTASKQGRCELGFYMNHQRMSSDCKLHIEKPKSLWKKVNNPNTWLYILAEDFRGQLICGGSSQSLYLNGSGTIQLDENCMIVHPTMVLHSTTELRDQNRSIVSNIQHIISAHINDAINNVTRLPNTTASLQRITIPQLQKEVDLNDVEEIEASIRQQQRSIETSSTQLRLHNVHHYTTIYLILIGIIVITVYWTCKERRCAKRAQYPVPAPRHIEAPFELPSLHTEAGGCTTHM